MRRTHQIRISVVTVAFFVLCGCCGNSGRNEDRTSPVGPPSQAPMPTPPVSPQYPQTPPPAGGVVAQPPTGPVFGGRYRLEVRAQMVDPQAEPETWILSVVLTNPQGLQQTVNLGTGEGMLTRDMIDDPLLRFRTFYAGLGTYFVVERQGDQLVVSRQTYSEEGPPSPRQELGRLAVPGGAVIDIVFPQV